ncbi:hypothetical protein F4553_001482 [Allocatelliglobosispora scoriae]|uniref:LamG-like jellyroll fold domain-containing protein n=1 Tax=Allocatelliglobosispora scoriae TaxID=643052 RepID=A0A841BMA2_9ACTN|nr:LamG domain-containing protein [Allocatelliglobosispora scoriae]MBB5868103.1 hypothetical protein [Allocatelliglobosispora scoriae]
MGVLLAGLLPVVAAGSPAVAAVAKPSCVDTAVSEEAAIAVAVSCARRVTVAGKVTELTQVYAEPSGRLRFESAVLPQRARQADGSWKPVDLALRKDKAGLLRPGASVADVRFSAGGSGPLVTLVEAGGTMTMSWPGVLPAPTVADDSATYPEVLSGVDLVVRATRTGFTHVLVVKTPQAAANPALKEIRFAIGGDATVQATPDGGMLAKIRSRVVATASPAVMWDSTEVVTGPAAEIAARTGEKPEFKGVKSTHAAPGDTAKEAPVHARATSSREFVLRPDAKLLAAPASAFPLFIDPPWSTVKSRWAYATNNGSSNTDYSVARVGRNPDTGALFRSFFDFPVGALAGKYVHDAYVAMKLTHSWSCGDTENDMYYTQGITATMKTSWTATSLNSWLSSTMSHANEAGGCSDSPQPDQDRNFTGPNVTYAINAHAAASATNITIGFVAGANATWEAIQDRWKRWLPGNAVLVVDFSSYPGQPTGLQVAGVACPGSGVMSIGTSTPTLSAVFPDADGSQTMSAAFEWLEVPANGVYDDTTPRKTAPPAVSAPANTRGTTSALSGIIAGKTYAYRVRHTDPAPYNLVSPWSPWCTFAMDDTVPGAPSITAVTLPTGPGTGGVFTLSTVLPADADVVKFRYGWSSPPLLEATATGTTTKTATISVTVPKYGQNILYVHAIDATGNKGNDSSRSMTVSRPSPAVARWGLETYPGTTSAMALADRQPALAGNTPLTTYGGATWQPDARLMNGATMRLDGTTGYLRTTGPVLDTTKSFSVAAWVRPTNLDDYHNIATQRDDLYTRFNLYTYWDKYCFASNGSATEYVDPIFTCATAPAQLNVWTHVAGVWDSADGGKLRIYVNGVLAGPEVADPTSWAADGPVVIGRWELWDEDDSYWAGDIADVQLFNRVLVANDFTGQRKSDPLSGGFDEPGMFAPIEVGRWDMEAATPCYAVGNPGTCEAPDGAAWGRRMALSQGSWVDLGHGNGQAVYFDDKHWADDPADPFYNLTTQEYGRSQRNTGTLGAPVWGDSPVLRTNGSFTVSTWVKLGKTTGSQIFASQDSPGHSGFHLSYRDSNGGQWVFKMVAGQTDGTASHTTLAAAAATSPTTWHHLVGVADASKREIRLYVDGALAATMPLYSGWQPWQASGPLVLGRGTTPTGPNDWFTGALDDVRVYQGAMTEGGVMALYESQKI